jgi:selenocysteine lyase/cysteine desulfurase
LPADQRSRFELDERVAYFNTANLSPLLRDVRGAGEAALERRARPWDISPADWFSDVEELRARFARLINADADGVALVPATSYGLAVVARNVAAAPGDRVLVLDEEFPSNYYTWQRFARRTGAGLVVVAREPGQSWTEAVLDAIDERVLVASVPNVHWTDGALVDLPRVAGALEAAGAALVIDASQSVGAMPLDVAALRPAAVVAVGYKWLLGPFGLGYLYLDSRFHGGEPLEENWILRAGSEDFGSLVDYRDQYLPGARRFDVGQRTSFHLVPLALAALGALLDWGVEEVAATLKAGTDGIAEGAGRLGVQAVPAGDRGPHMLGLRLPGEAAARAESALAERGVVAGIRGPSLRISPHLHNHQGDVDRLLDALAAALSDGPGSRTGRTGSA